MLLEQEACGWSRRRVAGAGAVWKKDFSLSLPRSLSLEDFDPLTDFDMTAERSIYRS